MTDPADFTYAAVIRSSSDARRVLAESPDWNTRRDAEILGARELADKGWAKIGVLCIEERR